MELDKLILKKDEIIIIGVNAEVSVAITNVDDELEISGPFNMERRRIIVSSKGMNIVGNILYEL